MTIRTSNASTCHAHLVYAQYSLCGYIGDLTSARKLEMSSQVRPHTPKEVEWVKAAVKMVQNIFISFRDKETRDLSPRFPGPISATRQFLPGITPGCRLSST